MGFSLYQNISLPEIRLLAQEHQIEAICCPTCHTTSLGSFPAAVSAPVQYGPNLQALAVYLHQGQLLPTARTCEALAATCGCQISEGTLIQWSELAAERLARDHSKPGANRLLAKTQLAFLSCRRLFSTEPVYRTATFFSLGHYKPSKQFAPGLEWSPSLMSGRTSEGMLSTLTSRLGNCALRQIVSFRVALE